MRKLIDLLRKSSDTKPKDQAPRGHEPHAPHSKAKSPVPKGESKAFADLGLMAPLLKAVAEQGYEQPTPIQVAAIPEVLTGRDLLGCAQTGTGKTAAFALPILQRLKEMPQPAGKRSIRTLVLTPTRELALQIDENFRDYGRHVGLGHAIVFGGVGFEPQKRALAKSPDILVATPGRLLDLMNQGYADLSGIQIFVLDEADRMLDMGFINDVRRVVAALPKVRQNLLFSATMPPEIAELAGRMLKDPARVEVTPVSSTSELVSQSVYFVDRPDKRRLLLHILERPDVTRALVFTRTKAIANRVAAYVSDAGIQAEAIHGNKSQSARQRALANFKSGETPVLVASDLAARGIDVDLITHVINYDLPNVPETYVHRIGRTGRAENRGQAISFCDHEERPFLKDIERVIKMKVPVVEQHPFVQEGGSQPQSPAPTGRPAARGGPSRPRPDGRSSQASSGGGQGAPGGKRRRRSRGKGGRGGPGSGSGSPS